MIELSKCPNCAEEDRVTIAGKEFCMRCGTPMEDNAMMGAGESAVGQTTNDPSTNSGNTVVQAASEQPQTPPTANAVLSTEQNTSNSVQKFSANPIQPSISHVTVVPTETDQMQTDMSPMAQTNSQPAMATNVTNSDAKPAIGVFTPPPRMEDVANQQPQSAGNKIAIAQTSHTESDSPANAMNTMMTAPAMGSMKLDKKSPGVLSDEQFDQLKQSVNTAVASDVPPSVAQVQSNYAPMPTEQPQSISSAQPASDGKVAMATDIYGAQPQQESSPALQDSTLELNSAQNNSNASSDVSSAKTEKKASKIAKPAAIVASIAILFATGAYIWKMNYPSLAFKIASAKAGMSATMPGYVPTGYNLGGQIQTNPGSVSYSLINGGSSDKKITVTQAKTDWDSQALAENYVAPKVENYLALQAQGLTIYVLGQNQATWINKGTWYRLDSAGQPLNQDQIIKIATSL